MELFVINRYTGDEPPKDETSNEEYLKKKLLKKIKERKRLSEISIDKEENDFKHKKRKKLEDSESSNLTENQLIGDESTNGEIVEKKKKNKNKDVTANGELEDEDNSIGDSSKGREVSPKVEKSKKKKRKKKRAEEIEVNGVDNEIGNADESLGQQTSFTILGDAHMAKKEKVKRKLPDWLANPSVVSVDLKNLKSTVDSIPELDKIFVDELKENGISHFFPVQSQIIPWLLKNLDRPSMYWPNDICVSAPTGSGKTLAFVLPILQALHKRIVPRIRALVVLPVQDLANQVFKVFKTYSKVTNLNVLLLSRERKFEEEQSLICKNDGMGNYRTLVDIIVTTPGRLVHHLNGTKGLSLDDLTYLVIDEADRVMENDVNDWLYHLNKRINSECTRSYQIPVISYNNMFNRKKPPNKLLFSATLSQDPEKLQQLGLFQPKLFTSVVKSEAKEEDDVKDETKFIGKYTTPAELTEYYTRATKASKPLLVHHLIQSKSWKNVLCFVNSAEATTRLAFVLKALSKKGATVAKLSANLHFKNRDVILKKFSEGEIDILVCSDALARGIDISNVRYVISYDAPKFVKTYIHRIGRTGRAGKEGTSLVLLTSKEVNNFQKMIENAGKSSVEELVVDDSELEQYEAEYEKALTDLGEFLEKKKRKLVTEVKAKKKLHSQAGKGKFFKKSVKKKAKRQKKSKNSS